MQSAMSFKARCCSLDTTFATNCAYTVPVLIGLRVVRSPNGAHDTGIETMKKFLLGTVGLVAFGMAAPATATGFYIGANGGWGSSDSCVDFLDVTGVQCR
jgi:hypothetical protein